MPAQLIPVPWYSFPKWDTAKDRRYSNASTVCKMDAYLPRNGNPACPVIVYVHGGGWSAGDKRDGMEAFAPIISAGVAVVSINYRFTSSSARHPTQLLDVKTAIRALRKYAVDFRISPDHIVVMGASAGGHLAAMCGLTNGNPAFDVGDFLDVSSDVIAVVDDYGPTDLAKWCQVAGDPNRLALTTALLGASPTSRPDLATAASPAKQATADAPPMLIRQGTSDTSVPLLQSQLLHSAVQAVGGESTLWTYQGYSHGDARLYSPTETAKIVNWLAPLFAV